MGVKDTVTKDYMNDPRIFADAFNFFLYNGRQVILPERIRGQVPETANKSSVKFQ